MKVRRWQTGEGGARGGLVARRLSDSTLPEVPRKVARSRHSESRIPAQPMTKPLGKILRAMSAALATVTVHAQTISETPTDVARLKRLSLEDLMNTQVTPVSRSESSVGESPAAAPRSPTPRASPSAKAKIFSTVAGRSAFSPGPIARCGSSSTRRRSSGSGSGPARPSCATPASPPTDSKRR